MLSPARRRITSMLTPGERVHIILLARKQFGVEKDDVPPTPLTGGGSVKLRYFMKDGIARARVEVGVPSFSYNEGAAEEIAKSLVPDVEPRVSKRLGDTLGYFIFDYTKPESERVT